MPTIGIALIGCGAIALANHIPGIALCPDARLMALCDSDKSTLEKAAQMTGISVTSTDYRQIVGREDVQAVIVATPNFMHAPMVLAAIKGGKHVLCEKPLAMNFYSALRMCHAAESAGVRHMTAFTYRFVPAMRYMAHLVHSGNLGTPFHFRAQRFQDWGDRNLGWRQVKKLAATGELGDMLSHRIDYGLLLVGPISRVVARLGRCINSRGGQPSDVDDWISMLGEFQTGASGVWESTKLATGHGEGGGSHDLCEVNGSDGSAIYSLGKPHEIRLGRKGSRGLETVRVPDEFLRWPSSPRDPRSGDPIITFRFDQDVEFIDAIVNQRPCQPSFLDGVRVQAVMDAAVVSDAERRWVDVASVGNAEFRMQSAE